MDNDLTRRGFLRRAAGVAGAAAVPWGDILGSAPTTAGGGEPLIPQRTLGKTGVKVSILGLGGQGLLCDSTDKEAVEKFLQKALDSGINYFDTAPNYGKDQRSEKNLGLLMGTPRRKEAFLATKVESRDYDGALKQVETSLKNLRTDRLDLIQVHHVYDKDEVKDFAAKTGVLTGLQKLRDQKVVRFIGVTGHPNYPQVKQALEAYEWDTFMCFVNPAKFCDPVFKDQIPLAQKQKAGIIAMKVLGGEPGELVGTKKGQADAASLLRFALSQPVSTVIVGMASLGQLAANVETARAFRPLGAEQSDELRRKINSAESQWKK
jgi:aryl-alcohol dehydrogenase-like predicted oxidoreductase